MKERLELIKPLTIGALIGTPLGQIIGQRLGLTYSFGSNVLVVSFMVIFIFGYTEYQVRTKTE